MVLLCLAAGGARAADEGGAKAAEHGWLDALDRGLGDVVSPRSLARAHADLEGITRCGDCHAGLTATPAERCLACHEDVAARMRDRIGWHGQLEGDCVDCHAEHRGEGADLLGLDRESFNHELARFPLRGAHLEVKCDDCHQRAGQDGKLGFHPQGIAFERCADCHEDVHGAEFLATRDCGVCHGDRSFGAEALAKAGAAGPAGGPAEALPGGGFEHARDTRFALEGAHASVPCASCHTPERREAERAARRAPGSAAPQDCAGCHEDPHAGALGAACTTCHTPASWAAEGKGARFDHARDTRFPLDALHARLDCAACHEGLSFAAKGRECADCHEAAAALLAGRLGDVRSAPDPHAAAVKCRDCHADTVAAPGLLDYERACLACHPAPYGSLLVTRKRLVDEALVKVEAALRARALARRRGEAAGDAAREAGIAAQLERIAKSGLHHAALSEATLLQALETLGAEEGRSLGAEGARLPGAEGAR
jgi:hypothetical protein